jgi:peptidoglycan hydrolase FlgJ
MPSPVNDASVYGDFAGLEKLKAGVRGNDAAAIRQVAQQFESLFARMMIKSMRDAVGKDPIFGSDQAQTYQSMYDGQLSLELTRGKGLGLADMLVRQLQRSAAVNGGAVAGSSAAASNPGAAVSGLSGAAPGAPPASAAQRASFISQVWPQAEEAARQLGVHPLGLVAQAALESNWGQSVPRGANGASSNNLFGIKAGSSWSGPAVSASTQEFSGGAARTLSAAFRSYSSPAQSFQDYVALLRGNPRFSAALGSGSVPSFAGALQQAGYATDPDYAHKVTAVAEQVASTLKLASGVPMTSMPQAPGEESGHG